MVAVNNLTTSLKQLVDDADIIARSEKLGIHDLNDLMNVNLETLKQHKEFTFTWYAEILDLLKNQGLLRKFQKKNI